MKHFEQLPFLIYSPKTRHMGPECFLSLVILRASPGEPSNQQHTRSPEVFDVEFIDASVCWSMELK